jgi:hypothetical protein
MELQPIIDFLTHQRLMIDQTIACLERLSQTADPTSPAAPKRRGRKFMGTDDRQKVSERMKEYWAARREQKGSGRRTLAAGS